VVLTLVFLGLVIAVVANEKLGSLANSLVSKTRFDITSADIKLAENETNNRRKSKRKIGMIFTGILLASVMGLFVNYISSKIF
jgi:ABC-type phosphate/phosphonate transport system ATPase subunit